MKSTHFGACLGLARDRLIRLGWATPASPNQFLRFLFLLSADCHGTAFSTSIIVRNMAFR